LEDSDIENGIGSQYILAEGRLDTCTAGWCSVEYSIWWNNKHTKNRDPNCMRIKYYTFKTQERKEGDSRKEAAAETRIKNYQSNAFERYYTCREKQQSNVGI